MNDTKNPFPEYVDYGESNSTQDQEAKKEKRYFWIKLKEGFFDDKYIKAIRARQNGYRILVIYLSMQLKALKTDGMLSYEKLLPNYADELALMLNEEPSSVAEAIEILEKFGLIEVWDDETVFLTAKQEIIEAGNEGASAERVRRCREKKKSLQCNNDVTRA